MFRVSVVGASGYTGFFLVRLLLKHPHVQMSHLAVRQKPLPLYSDLYPSLLGHCDKRCTSLEDVEMILSDSDVVFFSLPHTVSMRILPKFFSEDRLFIDLSGDYRLDDPLVYEKFYGKKHESVSFLKDFTYGLSEVFTKNISQSRKIANPGCFSTAVQLALYPLLHRKIIETDTIFVDGKTGVSGAGKTLRQDLHFFECNENLKAYKPGVHQHQAEMEQEMSRVCDEKVRILFVPHLTPINRGIYITICVRLRENKTIEDIAEYFRSDYSKRTFVRILPEGCLPELKNVFQTNFCDISFMKRGQNLLIFSALDNLMKGASAQAVQNMNIALGLPETEGLFL